MVFIIIEVLIKAIESLFSFSKIVRFNSKKANAFYKIDNVKTCSDYAKTSFTNVKTLFDNEKTLSDNVKTFFDKAKSHFDNEKTNLNEAKTFFDNYKTRLDFYSKRKGYLIYKIDNFYYLKSLTYSLLIK